MEIDIDSYFEQATYVHGNIKPLMHLDQFEISGRTFRLIKDMTSQVAVMLAYKEVREKLHKEGIIFTPFAIWQCDHVENNDVYTKYYTATAIYTEVIETGEQTLMYLISPDFKLSSIHELNYNADNKSMFLAGLKYFGFNRKPDLSNNPITALKLRSSIKSANVEVDDNDINRLIQVYDSTDSRENPVEIWFIQDKILIIGDSQRFLDRLGIEYKLENPFD